MLPTREATWPSTPHHSSSPLRSKSISRRRAAAWDLAGIATSGCLMIAACLTWAAARHTADATRLHGQLLGVLCLVLGAAGCVAAGLPLPTRVHTLDSTRTRQFGLPVRTGLLLGLVVALMSTLGFMAEVSHDVHTNCLLAEASVRISHLEDTITKLKHDELLTQVFFRLNELDDLLSAAAASGTAHTEVHSEAFHLHHQDRAMISERVSRLRRHADALLEDMRSQLDRARAEMRDLERNTTTLEGKPPATSFAEYETRKQRLKDAADEKKRKEEALWLLEKRVEAVDSVIQYIEARSHDTHRDLTFEEYEIILKALLDGSSPPPEPTPPDAPPQQASGSAAPTGNARITYHTPPTEPVASAVPEAATTNSRLAVLREALDRDQASLSSVKAAFERRNAAGPDYLQLAASDPRARAIHELQAKQEASRRQFEGRFFSVFEEGAGHFEPDRFWSSIGSYLNGLPAHCLRDEAFHNKLRWVCVWLLITQVAAAFTVVTGLAHKLAFKDE